MQTTANLMRKLKRIASRFEWRCGTTGRILFVAALATRSIIAVPQRQQNPLTVCEVMKQLKVLNGKTVTLRGPVLVAKSGLYADELLPTAAESCTAPKTPFPAQIKIDPPDFHFLKNPPPGYKLDQDSVSRFQEAIKRAQLRNPSSTNQISVVVQGVLTVNEEKPFVRKRDKWYPAHLILQSYKSIEPQ